MKLFVCTPPYLKEGLPEVKQICQKGKHCIASLAFRCITFGTWDIATKDLITVAEMGRGNERLLHL